ncbi:MAG: pentapeptide repeat-containing protein [Deltaproteobacteria bacterium]
MRSATARSRTWRSPPRPPAWGARIPRACLSRACLSGARLSRACLSRARLSRARLSRSTERWCAIRG